MTCSLCKKKFVPSKYNPNQIYCSVKCYRKSDKYKDNQKKYRQSDKYKEYKERYEQLEKVKIRRKKWRQSSDSYKEGQKKWKKSDEGKESAKKYDQSEKGKEAKKKYFQSDKYKVGRKEYFQKNKNKLYKNRKKRFDSEPLFKISINMRNRLNRFLKSKNIKKTNKTFQYVGCTPKFLKQYLEKKFKPGMTWHNHGVYGWHIDHIKPLSRAKTLKGVEILMHFKNLQPMWAKDNLEKSNKII